MTTDQDLERFLAENAISTVILCGTDLIGKQRGKRLTASYFRDVARKGVRLASFINRAALLDEPMAGILADGVPDIVGMPDLSTLRPAGWEPGSAIVFLDWLQADGGPHPLCVRRQLRAQTEALAALGYRALAAFELEFFLIPRSAERPGLAIGDDDGDGMPREVHCYGVMEGARDELVLSRLRAALPDLVEGVIPEWGHGQREVNLRPADPVSAADRAILLKLATRSIAAREGFAATFMAKWRRDRSGNSAHVHLSLRDERGAPVFHDAARPNRLSSALEAWVSGQLRLFRETAMFHAPFANSYRRFVDGSFAPTRASAGLDNRTVAFRILNHAPEATRVEHRVAGADVNPYVSLAATLAAGRFGLEIAPRAAPRLEVGDAYAADLPRLPASIAEAVDVASRSTDLERVMSPEFTRSLAALLLHEAALVAAEVPDSETRRYFSWA